MAATSKLRYRCFMDTIRRMGKRGPKPEFTDRLPGARLPEGTIARIKAVLRDGEGQGEFVRRTLLDEVERREQESQSPE
jgi:hypothetical protein